MLKTKNDAIHSMRKSVALFIALTMALNAIIAPLIIFNIGNPQLKQEPSTTTQIEVSVNNVPTTPAAELNTEPVKSGFDTYTESEAATIVDACIMFSIWPGDEFGMSPHHLRHWVSYMRIRAGVAHITGYCNDKNCSHIDAGLFDIFKAWPEMDYPTAQTGAITDCMHAASKKGRHQPHWLIICDIDEYPFMPGDTSPGFLRRFVENATASQVLLRTMFFGEVNKRVKPNQTLFDAYTYRMPTAEPDSTRTKSLFRVDLIDLNQNQPNIVHAMLMPTGNTVVADPGTLRLNHYWGYRLHRPVSELQRDNSMTRHTD